jgi:hypothetical protein
MQERSISTQEVVRERILTLDPLGAHQQCEVTPLREDKKKNGKRILEIFRETYITGKKEMKLNKKKAMLEKLQETTKNIWKTSQIGTSQEASSQDLNLVGTAEPRRMGLHAGEAI